MAKELRLKTWHLAYTAVTVFLLVYALRLWIVESLHGGGW